MGQKNPKGSVTVTNDSGRIRLRWRYNKERFSFNLFAYSKKSLLEAKKIAVLIECDMLEGNFDSTLEKYKPENLVKVQTQSTSSEKNTKPYIASIPEINIEVSSSVNVVEQFEFWVKTIATWIVIRI